MVLGVIAKDKIYDAICSLNFRNEYDIRKISSSGINAIQNELESTEDYTHVLLDIDAIRGNSDNGLRLLDRCLKTTQLQFVVLAEGYPEDSVLVKNLKELGIDESNIILADGTRLKMRVSELLRQEEVSYNDDEEYSSEEIFDQTEYIEDHFENVTECFIDAETITPPSQISVIEAKQMMIKKPEYVPTQKAITIAVAGAGERIGSTTQCMQLLFFLKTLDYKVAVVEMEGKDRMKKYVQVYEHSSVLIDETHFIIQDNHFFSSPKALIRAKEDFDYIICDYGAYTNISDTISFFEKDIKVIVAGVKPWESEELEAVFEEDDGNLFYIFSFVSKIDEEEVLKQMLESADTTYFATYTPDYFQYGGNDKIYKAIIRCEKNKNNKSVKKSILKMPKFGRKRK